MNMTRRTQSLLVDNLSLEDALPTQMPVYVNSVVYLFGATILSALSALIATGVVMCLFGPGWYHGSRVGHFVNSLHFWSVQVFFAALVLHLASKYLMAAWRDGRWKTWMAGVLAFGVAVFTGLTGFLSQTNWDSQWIAVQAKDGMNALGIGAFFNTMNTGQALTLHIAVLPFVLVLLVAVHLFFIRREGPVRPLERQR
jgi:quinol-cytochrome oxidoreductase complex cytochrome b subunit